MENELLKKAIKLMIEDEKTQISIESDLKASRTVNKYLCDGGTREVASYSSIKYDVFSVTITLDNQDSLHKIFEEIKIGL